jgi:translation initiation factor IF-3
LDQKNVNNVNRGTRSNTIRVIGSDGGQIGIMPFEEARKIAAEDSLDLVEVSPDAKPPVFKIMDFGKHKYKLTKKRQEARRKQKHSQIKEIKVRPKTDDHDLATKVKHIRKFIEKNDKVKITMVFRGREVILQEQANTILEKIVAMTSEFAVVDQAAALEGRFMTMLLGPKVKNL